ncbi:hypothetical protein ACIOJE_39035 [Kitasatospora sp. NPDC087861]|uniref:hypothetical protein n=1 Tax=Kitasatospora sp. NPDC087861 TaxID=3364070 RepID=UPI00380D11A6
MFVDEANNRTCVPHEPRNGLTMNHQDIMESTVVNLCLVPAVLRPPAGRQINQDFRVGPRRFGHPGENTGESICEDRRIRIDLTRSTLDQASRNAL